MKVLGGNAMLHVEVRGERLYVHFKRYDDGWHIRCAHAAGEKWVGPLPTWAAVYRAGLRLAESMALRRKR